MIDSLLHKSKHLSIINGRKGYLSLMDPEVFYSVEHQVGLCVPPTPLAASFYLGGAAIRDHKEKSKLLAYSQATLWPSVGSFLSFLLSLSPPSFGFNCMARKMLFCMQVHSSAAVRTSLELTLLGTVLGFKWSRLCIISKITSVGPP